MTVLERPWGEVFDLQQIRDTLQKVRPKVLGIVHAETSTGAWQPLERTRQTVPRIRHACCWSMPSRRWAAFRWPWTPGQIDAVLQLFAERAWVVRRVCRRCRSVRAPSKCSATARRKCKAGISMSICRALLGASDRFYHHTGRLRWCTPCTKDFGWCWKKDWRRAGHGIAAITRRSRRDSRHWG